MSEVSEIPSSIASTLQREGHDIGLRTEEGNYREGTIVDVRDDVMGHDIEVAIERYDGSHVHAYVDYEEVDGAFREEYEVTFTTNTGPLRTVEAIVDFSTGHDMRDVTVFDDDIPEGEVGELLDNFGEAIGEVETAITVLQAMRRAFREARNGEITLQELENKLGRLDVKYDTELL